MSQEQMDGLDREWKAGLASREHFDTGYYYWRGRRDGYESAAFELHQHISRAHDAVIWFQPTLPFGPDAETAAG